DRAPNVDELVELVAPAVVQPDQDGVRGKGAVDAGRDPTLLLRLVARPGEKMAAPGGSAQPVDEIGGMPTALFEVAERAACDLAQAIAAARLVGIADDAEVLPQHHVTEHLVGRHGRPVVEM